jgi:hypothetical protein
MGNIIVMAIIFILISTAVAVITKVLNSLAEANAARRAEEERQARAERMERAAARARAAEDERAERPRPAAPAPTGGEHTGGTVRPAGSDMDRFLAEIDRLRRKAAGTPAPAAQPGSAPPVAPVVQPVKPPAEKPRPRVVAELAEQPSASTPSFGTSPQAPTRTAPLGGQVEQLPVATVLRPTSSTGAPATKVTRFHNRPRPVAKTNFGANLTALLASGQGVAMAVVLQEILGPPKAKKNAAAEPQG